MTYPRERRQEKRKIRRNNTHRWYHSFFDFCADALWFFVDIPWFIIRGVFHVLWVIIRGIGRALLSILEAIGDIFSAFS